MEFLYEIRDSKFIFNRLVASVGLSNPYLACQIQKTFMQKFIQFALKNLSNVTRISVFSPTTGVF